MKKVSLVFASGTSSSASTTGMIGLAGSGQVGGGAARTRGTQQTELARMIAPPPRHPTKGAMWALLIGGFWFFSAPRGSGVAGAILAFGAAVLLYRAREHNVNVWQPAMDDWHRKFLCERCGLVYVPLDANRGDGKWR